MIQNIQIREQLFGLMPQKALYWYAEKALILSDIHLGKATHFRKNGIPMPALAGMNDLHALAALIQQVETEKIFIVGDLFHSNLNLEWNWFLEFLNNHPHIQFTLLRGNHDILASYHLKQANFNTQHKYINHQICLIHEPRGDENEYVICGHIHPGYTLRGKGKQVLRLPCFVLGSNRTILPAFGKLTGLANFEQEKDDEIYVIADSEIIRIKR